jgi:H+/Cl- antiporter ClcA
MRSLSVVSLMCLVLGATQSVTAQAIPVDSGRPVRVALRAGPLIQGLLVRQTPESLVLQHPTGKPATHSMLLVRDVASVDSLVSRHSAGSVFKGLGLGALTGAVLGAIAAEIEYSRCMNKVPHDDMCGMAILDVPALALLGGITGTIVGAVRTTESWVPVWRAEDR